ncbi:MAG: hypothetical protein R3D34_17320 [Nitratireductor sp.]
MNDTAELFAYSGRLVQPGEKPRDASGHGQDSEIRDIDQAHAEAARIIAAANEEAAEIRQRKLAGLDLEFERRLAERLTIAASDFRFGLNECADVMASIVDDALRIIIGNPADPATQARAIETAARRHSEAHSLEILVSPED